MKERWRCSPKMESTDPGIIARHRLHATVFCQCFSPCGRYLATADNYGYIALFSLQAVLGADADEKTWKPFFRFKAHEGPIYSLVSTERQLISAGTGDIHAWNWTDITTKAPRTVWSLPIPSESKFDQPETNSVVLSQKGGKNQLFAGCGDNNVYIWDMDVGQLTATLKGHSNYIHQVALRPNGTDCVTASEDGTVRVWDTRLSCEVHRIEPASNELCVRPQYGKWIGCVAVDAMDDWMVCGGGPKLSLWHMRSLTCTSVFDAPKVCHQHVMFYEDEVISGGTRPYVYHWAINGDPKLQVPCTPTSVFSVVINTHSDNTKVLSVAGNSHKIDVCTNFGYKAFSMAVI